MAGYFVSGLSGAAVAALSLATPALLAIPIAHFVLRGGAASLRGASSGIVIASCALMLAVGLRLAPEAAPSAVYQLIVVGGAMVIALTTIKPVWVILISALCGLLL